MKWFSGMLSSFKGLSLGVAGAELCPQTVHLDTADTQSVHLGLSTSIMHVRNVIFQEAPIIERT